MAVTYHFVWALNKNYTSWIICVSVVIDITSNTTQRNTRFSVVGMNDPVLVAGPDLTQLAVGPWSNIEWVGHS